MYDQKNKEIAQVGQPGRLSNDMNQSRIQYRGLNVFKDKKNHLRSSYSLKMCFVC